MSKAWPLILGKGRNNHHDTNITKSVKMSIEFIFLYFQEVSYDKLVEFFRALDFLSVFWYKVNSRFTVSPKFATSLKETD